MMLVRSKKFAITAISLLFLLSTLWFTFNPYKASYRIDGVYDADEISTFDDILTKRELVVPRKYLALLGLGNGNGTYTEEPVPYMIPEIYNRLRSGWNLTIAQQDVGPREPPMVVTAMLDPFESDQMLGLLGSINAALPNLYTLVFDVGGPGVKGGAPGLKEVNEYCNMTGHCSVERFPAELFPDHVSNMANGAYIPLILQKTLSSGTVNEVLWADASQPFRGSHPTAQALRKARSVANESGRVLAAWRYPHSPGETNADPVSTNTAPDMYAYFSTVPTTDWYFYTMLNPAHYLLLASPYTERVMDMWVRCALTRQCLAPTGSQRSACAHTRPKYKYSGCHWYEASALSASLRSQLGASQSYFVGGRGTQQMKDAAIAERLFTKEAVTSEVIARIRHQLRAWKERNRTPLQDERDHNQTPLLEDKDKLLGKSHGGHQGNSPPETIMHSAGSRREHTGSFNYGLPRDRKSDTDLVVGKSEYHLVEVASKQKSNPGAHGKDSVKEEKP